ncbi:MAG: hypothetical protein JNM27_11345 [Leptospirales bacterium]|nr:hypothetical protein [Leptospirales bacterium]
MGQQKEERKTNPENWRFLTLRRDEFSRILQLLVDFDESTGRAKRYRDPETHYMRRAIAVANPDQSRIFLRRIARDVFSIVAETKSDSGIVVTSLILEDGIHAERATKPAEHPVHQIICTSDLFQRDCESIEPLSDLNPVTKRLLYEVETASKP